MTSPKISREAVLRVLSLHAEEYERDGRTARQAAVESARDAIAALPVVEQERPISAQLRCRRCGDQYAIAFSYATTTPPQPTTSAERESIARELDNMAASDWANRYDHVGVFRDAARLLRAQPDDPFTSRENGQKRYD